MYGKDGRPTMNRKCLSRAPLPPAQVTLQYDVRMRPDAMDAAWTGVGNIIAARIRRDVE